MEDDFSTARISGDFEAGSEMMTLQFQSSTTDDDELENTEGYILCIVIREEQLDPRDRGRIQIPLLRRDILITIANESRSRKSSACVHSHNYICIHFTY